MPVQWLLMFEAFQKTDLMCIIETSDIQVKN